MALELQHLLQQRECLQPTPVTARYGPRTMPRTRRNKPTKKQPPTYHRYVVRKGRRLGIFQDYDQVREYVENTNACHMGFTKTEVHNNVHHYYMQRVKDDRQVAKHELPGSGGDGRFVYEPLPYAYFDCDKYDSYQAWEQTQEETTALSLPPGPAEGPPPDSPNSSPPPPPQRPSTLALPPAAEEPNQGWVSPSYSPQTSPEPSPPKARVLHEGLQPGTGQD